MDRLSELGTARGFARMDVERAWRDLDAALAWYEVKDREYREYVLNNGEV